MSTRSRCSTGPGRRASGSRVAEPRQLPARIPGEPIGRTRRGGPSAISRRRRAVADRFRPARRHQAGRQVGQRGEHEESLRGQRDGAPPGARGSRARSCARLDRPPAGGRSTASRARPKTSRSRSSSRGPQRCRAWRPKAASMPLRAISRSDGPAGRIRAGRNVEGHDRVAELGLVGYARPVRWRTAARRRRGGPGQRGQGVHRRRERASGAAHVGPEADVRPDPLLRPMTDLRPPIHSQPCARSRVLIFHPEPGPGGRSARAAARRGTGPSRRDSCQLGFARAGANHGPARCGPARRPAIR